MTSEYPSDWDRRRKEVYKRDGYTCQNCGRRGEPHGTAKLHAHHIVPKSAGGTHKKSNLQTVCKECHQAIHGSSVAPSARNQQGSSQDYDISLDIDRFPYAASELVEFGNKLEKVANQHEKATKALDNALEVLYAHISTESEELPTHTYRQYKRCNEEATEAIQKLEKQTDVFTQQQVEFSKSTSIQEYEQFTEDVTKTINILKNYRSALAELINSEEVSDDELAEFKILDRRANESVNGFVNSAESLMTAINGEIRQILNDLNQGTSRFVGINPYSECPVCETSEDEMLISDEWELIRCPTCRTEFQPDSIMTWKAVYSPRPIEDVSLTVEMWKNLDLDYQSDSSQIKKLERASNKQSMAFKWSILAVVAVQALGLIHAITTGNLINLLFLVVISIIAGGILMKGVELAVLPSEI